jgi:hypothetical protein
VTEAAQTELAHPGTDSEVAKVRVLVEFSKKCVELIRLFPAFEPFLLAMVQPQAALPRRIEHAPVLCDGCEHDAEAAQRAEIQGYRNAHSHYFQGLRFKSVLKSDFDLCEMAWAAIRPCPCRLRRRPCDPLCDVSHVHPCAAGRRAATSASPLRPRTPASTACVDVGGPL